MGPLQKATMLEQDDNFDDEEDDHVSEKTRLNNEKSKRLDSGVLIAQPSKNKLKGAESSKN